MDRRALLRGAGGLGLLAALAGCAPSSPSLQLTIATGTTNGPYDKLGTALVSAWNDVLHPGAAHTLRTDGSVENVKFLGEGKVNVAISQLDVAGVTFGNEPSTAPTSMRALARIYDDALHVVVPQGSPIRSLTQLRGRTVSVGKSGSGVYFLAQRVLKAIGLSVTTDIDPVYSGIDTSPSALRAGEIEAFFWVGALGTSQIIDLAKTFPIRLVDVTDVLQQVQASDTYYSKGTVTSGIYAGVTGPIITLLVRNLLLVRSEMMDTVAHDLVDAMFKRQSQIALAAPSALTIDTRRGIGTEPVLLHPGAQQWFREARARG